MGYTHCWRYQPDSRAYAAAWPAIVQDSNHIIAQLSKRIPIAGPDTTGVPLLSTADGIAYNGGPGEHGEAFVLAVPGTTARQWWFCKTDGQPYDLAVTATLLRCHLLLPEAFLIASEGAWTADWQPARRLVKRLFGVTVRTVPFSDAALPDDDDFRALSTDTHDR
ncbi:hypothetical protein Ato02nite_098410 [Paractinoplanes toevensis]|uniref:Uncharacterized protein n=2 Tax=Paractinoplanes toevensis TaxID=571911 RepID=A0A919WDF2_9ACTN|nr:hypothetical protein Ato02nite_098410 [Actinoplanes toevensis]